MKAPADALLWECNKAREAKKELREYPLAAERQYEQTAKGMAVRHLRKEYSPGSASTTC